MRNTLALSIAIVFSFVNIFAQNYLYNSEPVYKSNRDNIYPNGFVNALAIHNDILYTLLDTGNIGVAKLFKIKKYYRFRDTTEIGNVPQDDAIEWQLYFGNENEYILRDQKLCYITIEGNIRIMLLQKIDNLCKPRIIDISPEGEILSDDLINISLALDAKIRRVEDNIFVAAFTDEISSEMPFVQIINFNGNGEIIKMEKIEDNSNSIKVTELYRSKDGDIAVVTAYHSFDCYWYLKFNAFDKDLNIQFDFTSDKVSPFHISTLNKRYNGEWYWEFPYFNFNDSLYPPPSTPVYRERRYFLSKDTVINVPHTDHNLNLKIYSYISEPYKDGFFRMGTSYFTNFKRCVWGDTSSIYAEMKTSIGAKYMGVPAYQDGLKNLLNNVIESSPSEVYALMITSDGEVLIYEINIILEGTSIEETPISKDKPKKYKYFAGSKAILPIMNDNAVDANIFIFDSMGNKLGSVSGHLSDNQLEIPIQHLTNGVYFYYIPEMNISGKFGVMR